MNKILDSKDSIYLLANAIVMKACEDYKDGITPIIKDFYIINKDKYNSFKELLIEFYDNRDNISNNYSYIKSFDDFFDSEWCHLLTNLDMSVVRKNIDKYIMKELYNCDR